MDFEEWVNDNNRDSQMVVAINNKEEILLEAWVSVVDSEADLASMMTMASGISEEASVAVVCSSRCKWEVWEVVVVAEEDLAHFSLRPFQVEALHNQFKQKRISKMEGK